MGGVGKAYIYRLVGVPVEPKFTSRPGFRTTLSIRHVRILDAGNHATEVAEALAKAWPFYLDLVVYMYDVTDVTTLWSLLEIERHMQSRDASLTTDV